MSITDVVAGLQESRMPRRRRTTRKRGQTVVENIPVRLLSRGIPVQPHKNGVCCVERLRVQIFHPMLVLELWAPFSGSL